MSSQDQCPSSKKQGKPAIKPRASVDHSAATGARLYRSIDDVADTPEFREHLEREFLPGASELNEESRREFIKMMGASLALAGVAGLAACRRPDHKIIAYIKEPEDLIPGNPIYYATSMPTLAGAQGLLSRTIDGRPTKLEGNPLHSNNQGKSDVFAQSAVLNLYDNDRLKNPREGETAKTWEQFQAFAATNFASFNAAGGQGLAFLVDSATGGPTRDAMRDLVKERWPRAQWVEFNPLDANNSREGSWIAFGAEHREVRNLARAKVVLSVADDFLLEPGSLSDTRGFAQGRKVHGKVAADAKMNRLYTVESSLTITGGNADHRLALAPSQLPEFLAALAAKVFARLGVTGGIAASVSGASMHDRDAWLNALADDLCDHENRGATAILVGEQLPAWCHALAHSMNASLGNAGSTISYVATGNTDRQSGTDALAKLTRDMSAGNIETLVMMGVNPVYNAPADLDFAGAMLKVPTSIYLGLNDDETAHNARWVLPESHFLESWGDARAADGTISPIQPQIAPLFDSKSQIELIAMLMGSQDADGYDLVRNTWKSTIRQDGDQFDRTWRRALHDGVVPNTAARRVSPSANAGAVSSATRDGLAAAHAAQGLELVIQPHPYLRDGAHANNPWLQEIPHPITKVCWDNPVLINPETAKRLRVGRGDKIKITVAGRSAEFAVWPQPGIAHDTLVVELGMGRTAGGKIAEGRGFDAYPIRTTSAMCAATGATVEKVGGDYLLASTQNHQSMEGRAIIREVDLAAWQKFGNDPVIEKDSYGNTKDLNFAARLGVESHTPLNRDVYEEGQSLAYETIGSDGKPRKVGEPIVGPTRDAQTVYQQWGMSIDLTMCTGCGSCITACQSENNIPIVGKFDINRNRQMHWIRVDRYFADVETKAGQETAMLMQPVACVHCENAPCETVCPVNATVHGPEGTNNMAYNRCIGTRYCSNNCPYKVRRFNWFDFATKEYPAEYGQIAEGLKGAPKPANGNWIPARMREKVDLVRQMQYNPNVTVRSRGVMEKCSYCIQRINRARIESKINPTLNAVGRIPDGFFQTACEQACPSDAIAFGDITNPDARVTALRDHGRSYMLLAYLNTRPRTTYMVGLRNPNPAIRTPNDNPFHHGDHSDHGAGHGDDANHGSGEHGGEHSFFDPARKAEDPGHKLSLSVLPDDPSRRSAIKTVIAGVFA